MPHSFSYAVSMNLEHSIKEGSHERYPVHLHCLRKIKKIKYPDFQAMTPLHPYLEANICLDIESKQILQTPSSPLDKDPPLTDLGPIDRDIFASPPPKKKKRQSVQSKTLIPSDGVNSNILYCRVPTQFQLSSLHHHLKGVTHQLDLSSLFNLYIFRPVTRKSWPTTHHSYSSL